MTRTILVCWVLLAGTATLFAQKPGEVRPKVADEHESRGNKLADEGKFAEAQAEYKKAVQAAPDWYSPHYELGYMYWNQGQQNKARALAELKVALQLNPDCWLCYMLQGTIADDTGTPEEAVALFKKAADIQPKSGRPWFALGWVYRRQERTEDAIAALKRAQELEPLYPSPYYLLGMTYYNQGRFYLAFDQLFAFLKLETTGNRHDKAKELTGFNVIIDNKAPKEETGAALAFCVVRAGHMAPERYRKSHPGAETYVEDLDEEADVMGSFAKILLESSASKQEPVPARFADLVKVKQAGFIKELLVAASADRFGKDKEAFPAGRMDEFLAWAKQNGIVVQLPKARCEVRWMGRTW